MLCRYLLRSPLKFNRTPSHHLTPASKRCIPLEGGLFFGNSRYHLSQVKEKEKEKEKEGSEKSSSHTHFGFRTVKEEAKQNLVADVFHSVADKYDLMNDMMSVGIHRMWKDELMRVLGPSPGTKLLDVAGGTGDIAFRFLEAIQAHPEFVSGVGEKAEVTVCDINPSMLEVGRERSRLKGYDTWEDPAISFIEGDAENLHQIPDDSMDAYTIAFGIRNCTHIDKVLKEAHRVLRRGGRFLCLEFSHMETFGMPNPVLQSVYDLYSFNVIPLLGQMVAGDRDSYQYLVESIRKFPTQAELALKIEETGFQRVSYKNMTFGVVAIHSGFKL